MSSAFDQLNLRPQERRIVVVVGLIVFVVLNFLLVTPLIGQLGQTEMELDKSKRTLAKYEAEIGRAPTYQRIQEKLQKEGGDVLSEELQLQRIVDNQARASGVQVSRYNPVSRTQTGRTNQFFEDQALTIDFTTGGKELVEFLVGMASGNSMIHVQDMTLRPVQNGTRLGGNIVFVASYQKKTPTTRALESGSQRTPAKSTAPFAAAKTNAATKTTSPAKTNAAAAKTTNHPAFKPKPGGPPPHSATNAHPVEVGARTISTNSTKPPKK